jgi:hypothetical protein
MIYGKRGPEHHYSGFFTVFDAKVLTFSATVATMNIVMVFPWRQFSGSLSKGGVCLKSGFARLPELVSRYAPYHIIENHSHFTL